MEKLLEMLMEMKVDQAEQRGELREIRKDLNYHIKRTDELQALAEEFKRYKWTVLGAIIVLAPFANRIVDVIFK